MGKNRAAWAVILALALPLRAQEPATNLQFSAFGTLGLAATDTHKVEFRRTLGQPHGAVDYPQGSVDTRFGVQASSRLSDTLLATVQVVSQYRYDNTYRPDLNWASLTWTPTGTFQARAGRIGLEKLPDGDYANVGYTMLWVRPPVEVYAAGTTNYLDGLDLSQTFAIGADSTLAIRAIAGIANEKAPGGANVPLDLTGSRNIGAALKFQSGGFRGRFSYVRQVPNHNFGPPASDEIAQEKALAVTLGEPKLAAAAEAFEIKGKPIQSYQLGGAWERGPVQAQAAVVRTLYDIPSIPDQWSGFASFGYRLGAVVPYGIYSREVSKRNGPVDLGKVALIPGPLTARLTAEINAAMHLQEVDQTSLCAGLRWDFSDRADLKVQVDRVRARNSTALWVVDDPTWNGHATVMSVTLDFIFGGVR